ncbi:MAG: 4-hydroxythreonine-4-phosphate dehydrogenase PdxA [Ignavibacteriaceae bacterium]
MKIVISTGDINGISPEIGIRGLQSLYPGSEDHFTFFIPANIFTETYKRGGCSFPYKIAGESDISSDKTNSEFVTVRDIGERGQEYGKPTRESGETAYKSFRSAYELLVEGDHDFMITLPLAKEALKLAGIRGTGHTELLAEWTSSHENHVMMFLSEQFKTALVTIHIPLSEVSKSLTSEILEKKVSVITHSLKTDFGISNPRIAILGLNPHSGENGMLGKEEIDVINPVIKKNSENLFGPFPSDAFFGMRLFEKYDLTLGMYHDQALIPFKLMNFESGVNFTAGLPIIRTSPDHGTAFDIAGKFIANPESFLASYKWGKQIRINREENAR